MSGIYAKAWQRRGRWVMSYVRPLSWMAGKKLLRLGEHLLALLLGGLIAIPLMLLLFWLQDLSGGTF